MASWSLNITEQLELRERRQTTGITTLLDEDQLLSASFEADRSYCHNSLPESKVSQGSPKQDGSVDALYGLGPHAQKSKTFISGIADWTGLPQSMTPIEIQRGKNEQPFAIRTRLGWTINGPPDWWKRRL